MKNSSINKLVEHLQNIYAIPQKKHEEQKIDEQTMKQSMMKNYRHHWRINGVVHQDTNLKRLPIGDLDNWEIFRINMSKRSYQYPKKFKGMKIPSVSREFNTFNGRQANGRIPYLYESDIPKIENLRQKMYSKPFRRTNTVRHEIFGFPSKSLPRSKSMVAETEYKIKKANY